MTYLTRTVHILNLIYDLPDIMCLATRPCVLTDQTSLVIYQIPSLIHNLPDIRCQVIRPGVLTEQTSLMTYLTTYMTYLTSHMKSPDPVC